jgi:hypothetical protein
MPNAVIFGIALMAMCMCVAGGPVRVAVERQMR